MKKYLLTSAAALAFCGLFTSCTHDLGYDESSAQNSVMKTYEQAFITAFGQPDPNQEWGFGTTSVASTRAMTRVTNQPQAPRPKPSTKMPFSPILTGLSLFPKNRKPQWQSSAKATSSNRYTRKRNNWPPTGRHSALSCSSSVGTSTRGRQLQKTKQKVWS